jgi:hypothetical protein
MERLEALGGYLIVVGFLITIMSLIVAFFTGMRLSATTCCRCSQTQASWQS